MLELSVIHRPGMYRGSMDLGRILEAMLYYDRVHLVISAQMFTGLWDILGPDDFMALLRHPTITATITPQFLAIQTDRGGGVITHRPSSFTLRGHGGNLVPLNDDIGSIHQAILRLPNRPGGTRAQVKKVVKLAKMSRYEKILGSEEENRQRILSLIKDQQSLKIFLRGWAAANGQSVNQLAIDRASIQIVEAGERFMVDSSVTLEEMLPNWDSGQTWALILGSGLIDQSQKMMVAARATAEKKAFGHRS